MADTATFNKLPIDTANTGKKVSGLARVVGSDTVFIQGVAIQNESAIPVSLAGTLPVSMSAPVYIGALAANNVVLPLDILTKTFGYNAGGQLITVTVTYLTIVYVKTYTYVSGNLATESAWVNQ